MFITAKRHEREKQELLGASNRLTEAILKNTEQGLFLLDSKDKIQPQVSQSLTTLFRRQDFSNLSFEKLLGPIVSAKTLTVARAHIGALLGVRRARMRRNRIRSRPSKCAWPIPTARTTRRITRSSSTRSRYRVSRGCGWCASPISRCGCKRFRIGRPAGAIANAGRDSTHRPANGRRAVRRLFAANRRLHEDHHRRFAKAGSGGRGVSPQTGRGSR